MDGGQGGHRGVTGKEEGQGGQDGRAEDREQGQGKGLNGSEEHEQKRKGEQDGESRNKDDGNKQGKEQMVESTDPAKSSTASSLILHDLLTRPTVRFETAAKHPTIIKYPDFIPPEHDEHRFYELRQKNDSYIYLPYVPKQPSRGSSNPSGRGSATARLRPSTSPRTTPSPKAEDIDIDVRPSYQSQKKDLSLKRPTTLLPRHRGGYWGKDSQGRDVYYQAIRPGVFDMIYPDEANVIQPNRESGSELLERR